MSKDYELKTRVDEPIFKAVTAIAAAQGLSTGSYVRRLLHLNVLKQQDLVSAYDDFRNRPRMGPVRATRHTEGGRSAEVG